MMVDEYVYFGVACSWLESVFCKFLPRTLGSQEGARPASCLGQEVEDYDWATAEKLTPQTNASWFCQVDFPGFSS